MIALSFFVSQVLAIVHPVVVATLVFSYENLDDRSTGNSLTCPVCAVVHLTNHFVQILEGFVEVLDIISALQS